MLKKENKIFVAVCPDTQTDDFKACGQAGLCPDT